MGKIEVFKRHLREKKAVKVISGISNFNLDSVKKVAIAAQSGFASALDVASREDVIKVAHENTKLPIFASSINPFELAKAVSWGADAVEIGNFDALYEDGISFSAKEVYEITLETMSLLDGRNIFTCVTVPGSISIDEQIALAKKLELIGVDLIQTEGLKSKQAGYGSAGLLAKAQVTIANTLELSRQVGVPIMTASGITAETTPLAFAAGASAVGVGSCINKLTNQIEMIATVGNIVGSVTYRSSVYQEIEENLKV